MNELSYIKNEPYTNKTKFENAVWYGLQKVLGKEFCKTGYFKPYWKHVLEGKWFHTVNEVIIDVDMATGISIKKQDVEKKTEGTKKNNSPIYRSVFEEGSGSMCKVRIYHVNRQIGYLDTTKLNDETNATALELSKQLNIPTHEFHIEKYWYTEDKEIGSDFN